VAEAGALGGGAPARFFRMTAVKGVRTSAPGFRDSDPSVTSRNER
jgi:hypothetical protein